MKKILLYITVFAGLISYFACKKNDAHDGPPVISQIRSVDTLKRDSFFVQAVPGSLIVIQGNNLDGLQAVYFNDTLAYFNPTYATSTNIILSIPASAQTAATNPGVPSVIKVVTNHGTVTFPFSLYLYPPNISSISFDNSGTLVYINGNNFQGIKKIQFPTPGKDSALGYTVNKTFTQITAVIPPGTALQDSLRVFCTFGSAAFSYPPPMAVTSVSNENAAGGTTLTFTGSNFIGISKVIFPGGLLGTNITPINVTQFSVVVPKGIKASDSVRIQGALGSATAPQLFDTYISHPSPGYLSTFEAQYATDNTGFVGWTGGYGDSATIGTNYPGGTGAAAIMLQGSPMKANSAAGSQGNSGLLQLNKVPWVSNTGDAVSGYSLKFEVAVAKPWSAGEVWISLGGWYGWSSYTGRFAPFETAPGGIFQPTGWVTATIPLSQFITKNEFYQTSWNPAGSPAVTFKDYPTTEVGFLLVNDQAKPNIPANSLSFAIDNVRIVKGK